MRTASTRIVGLAVLALCASLLAVPSSEAVAGDSYLLLKAGGYEPLANDVKDDLNTGFAGEVAVGHYFLPFLGAEFAAGYIDSSKGANKLTVVPVTLAAKLRIPIPVVKPYAIAGGGAYIAKAEALFMDSQSDTAFGYFAGAGADFKLLFVLLNVEAKYLWAKPTFFGQDVNIDGAVVTVGVGFEF